MQYYFTPMHKHIDFGFGMTGNAFKEAADKLESEMYVRGEILGEHLPILFLRRHAIELFLKSAIVITHKKLNLSFGDNPSTGEPCIKIHGKWKFFNQVHSIKSLWIYFRKLCQEHEEFFKSKGGGTIDFEPKVEDWIEIIEKLDPRSTFFRYPSIQKIEDDEQKSAISEIEVDKDENASKPIQTNPGGGEKSFILIQGNDSRGIFKINYYTGKPFVEFADALKCCALHFFNLHASMRALLCGGN